VNWNQIRPWLGTVARLVLGVVFLIAGWQKMQDPRTFLRAVRAYDASPEWLSHAIAYGMPVLEICLALMLIFGIVTRYAAAVTGVLLAFFLIGIIEVGARGIKLDCGCFGGGGGINSTGQHTTYLLDSARDIGLLALAAFLVLWPLTQISIDEFLARNDNVELPSAKRMRSAQGQRKYNAMLEARRQEARIRNRYLATSLALLVVLVSVIGIGVNSNRAKISGATSATNVSATNGVVLGKPGKVTIDLFEDFQCPICQQLQTNIGADLDALISSGKAEVRFHMVSFLDASSNGNKYSTRAANASYCASDISTGDFLKYHDYLYSTQKGVGIQPAENSNGRTDADLETYAKAIGIDGVTLTTFQGCVTGEQHLGVVQAVTDNWSKRGLNGTPILIVNGKQISNPTKATLDAAVTKADPTATAGLSASGTPTITPDTPSPTATATGSSALPSATASPTVSASASASASP
jgi:protein-disulfide isomerase